MNEPLLRCETELTIPFFDVDSIEIVWHGHYAKYFEMARCELLDKLGYNYVDMKASGYAWPVVDMRIKYVKPLHFQQRIHIISELVEHENRLKIDYRIEDANTGEKLSVAYTIQVAVNMAEKTMCYASPKALLDKIEALKNA
ncbi:MAG: hypothetical protein COV52_10225 [Gammaproteobacteria bacterium CG11_big_fil_rev_8_21_14_0_20_46_22]|nr:MAG: hypothetical protein COW05_09450 [Gammaproteobacteria bacterium CG12_big_fil_rev_8_21_14_0_65_46_12]PIR10073.1 MAG: hypothetical protein COV52_10225 [Gammaproteobacteria bacterium CG11_big_fil_rev_8_21_14_0_20_46_22]